MNMRPIKKIFISTHETENYVDNVNANYEHHKNICQSALIENRENRENRENGENSSFVFDCNEEKKKLQTK